MSISEADKNILKTSDDARLLKNTAIACVKSIDPKDHALLTQYLDSAGFLQRLDNEESYRGTWSDLRLARVMQTTMEQYEQTGGSKSLESLLLGLIDSKVYQGNTLRRQLLIRALAVIKPSPEKAVSYWQSQSLPDGILNYDVAQALCVNQSEPAMTLLANLLSDSSQETAQQTAWMQQIVMPIRNDTPVLKACEQAITSPLEDPVKFSYIEALFDYKAQEWFMDCEPPEPPSRSLASIEAKEVIERIGRYALDNVNLNEELRRKVALGLKEIGVDDLRLDLK